MFGPVDVVAELEAALGSLDAVLGADAAEVVPGSSAEAEALIRVAERVRREAEAIGERVLAAVDASQAWRCDAHASATVMVRHVARLSAPAATRRQRGVRMARDLPELAAAFGAGELGVDQWTLLGRVWSNPRVRDAMADAQGWFLDQARGLPFCDFEAVVRRWERLADADGPEPRNSANHDRRDVRLAQDPVDLGWTLTGRFGALQGAAMHEILQHYLAAERLADWDHARERLGDTATAADLPRSEAQRRADALHRIVTDAAAANGTAVPVGFTHTIIWTAETYEEMLTRLAGAEPTPFDTATYRCETIDGIPLEPTEAAAHSLIDSFRRAVVDAAGVTIDLGRARCFTGSARTAIQISADTHCPWPGCWIPITQCQIDHTVEHHQGGKTNPGNGGPFCGRHNRTKHHDYTVWRDPHGTWHIQRPDGTEIEP